MDALVIRDEIGGLLDLYIEHMWVNHHIFTDKRKYVVFAYIAYGRGTAVIGDEKFECVPRDIFIINPGTRAEFYSKDKQAANFNFEIHHILFTVDFLRGEWEKYGEVFVELEPFINSSEGYIKVTDNDMNEIRNYIVRMINEYYEAAPGYESALLGHMLSVMPVIFRRRNLNDERIFSKNTLVDEAIRQIKNTIYKNPKPSDIAERHYVTIDHLGRVFKRETGMTLTQYINKLRVEMTKDILQNTNRPIEHIPEVFGIKLKYLQQVFKRYTGISMREYRSKRHYR